MARDHYHPEKPLKKKLTRNQVNLLQRIVKTNGGGVSILGEHDSVVEGLVKRHLIQGKSGHQGMMVHTREGLELARALRDAAKETVG